jgi:hypothetical protein
MIYGFQSLSHTKDTRRNELHQEETDMPERIYTSDSNNEPITIFSTEEGAERVAAANREGNSDLVLEAWTYTVKPYGKGFAVEVADETGEVLGNL